MTTTETLEKEKTIDSKSELYFHSKKLILINLEECKKHHTARGTGHLFAPQAR